MIDMRSDTASLPTPAMLEAIRNAPLGDEILGEDPTVKRLEALAAEIFGKEAALFTVSGTMSNQIAVMAFTQRGDEIVVGSRSHIYNLEAGGLSALSQVQPRPLEFPQGRMDPAQVEEAIRPPGVQNARTGLVCLENTYDLNKGYPVTAENTAEVCRAAHGRGVPVYLDGARIFNAAISLGTDVRALTREVDAVQVCLTKGLGAPFGALLMGEKSFIEKCKWLKQRLGGGLRQGGVVAAPGVVALTSMRERLREDHENARRLALGLKEIDATLLDAEDVRSNAVGIDASAARIDPETLLRRLSEEGIKIKRTGPSSFRLMTYPGITREHVETVLAAMKKIFAERR
ncbi:MAG: PLP-dependent transferase [Candidatus Accumulibacter sp.]|jgi:threonine aldolase|nr:PLP-dependent transferase [Accumulibacter sp.]